MRQKIFWNRICEVTTSTYPLGTLGSVVFFFKTTIYTSKEFLMGTISSRILHQLRYIYPVRRCRWNVVSKTYWLYIWVIWRVSYNRHELLILRGHLCWGVRFAHIYFCVVELCVFPFLVPCCDVCCDFSNNNNKKFLF